MKKIARKDFLFQSSLLMTGAMAGMSFTNKGKKPLMSFSTLGCPAWNFTQITSFAKQHGYQGLEMRGILKELYLPKCPEFASASAIKTTMQEMADKQLQFVDLGSSCNLHFAEGAERQKHLDEGKRFLDLAAAINCPNVRVYPNKFPKDQTKQQTMDLITKGLLELSGLRQRHEGKSVDGDPWRSSSLCRLEKYNGGCSSPTSGANLGYCQYVVRYWRSS